MKELWRKYSAQVDALSLRERAMVFVAALAGAFFMMYALFIEPAIARKQVLSRQMSVQQAELQGLQAKIGALEMKLTDPDDANRTRRDDMKRQIAEIDESLKGMEKTLVPAPQMKAVLQAMLARNPRLQLVALRTLPVTPLVEKRDKAEKSEPAAPAPETPSTGGSGVYKHGVRITVQGSYADLHDYLARLEKASWHMFWSRASLNAEDYPRLTLTVTIYTLSLDKAWLVV